MTLSSNPQQPAMTSLEEALNDAVGHHQAGRANEAAQIYRAILKADPNHPDANHNFGVLALQAKQPKASLVYFETALKARPDRGQYWLSYIDALIRSGHPDAARNVLDQARQRGFTGPAIERFVTMLNAPVPPMTQSEHSQQGPADSAQVSPTSNVEHQTAKKKASKETAAKNNALSARNAKSPTQKEIDALITLFNQGKTTEVEKLARQLTARFPKHPLGWKALGAVLHQQGRSAEALMPKQKAAELLPGDAEAHNNLAVTLQDLGQLAAAEACCRRAIALRPNYPEAHGNLGNALAEQGRHTEAEACYKRALQLKPDYVEAHHYLGNSFREQGKFNEAGASIQRALELWPENAEAFDILGLTFQDQGRMMDAEASYRRALALQPTFHDALNHLGTALQEQGRLAEAEESYRKAIQLKNDYAEAYANLGLALEEQRQFEEAEACYRRAVEIEPDYMRARYSILRVLQKQHRLDGFMEAGRDILRSVADCVPKINDESAPVPSATALMPIGRSGSMFFHSLFDGHPELTTLPGVYFKGWFGQYAWNCFAPDPADPKWRERLVATILREFEPMFDARSKKNVIGKPFDNAIWLSKSSGFMEMGADQSQPFIVDQVAFSAALLSLLAPVAAVGPRTCFELVHQAFDIAIRGHSVAGSKGKHIFYHIHNPSPFELSHFLHCYPQARLMYIVRQPVQAMESWMMGLIEEQTDTMESIDDTGANNKVRTDSLVRNWTKIMSRVNTMFDQIRSPFNTLACTRGVRLEDVKREPGKVMPQIAKWMGISDHPSLYEASFCGIQYWGPASKVTGKITGFDTKAIDRPVGRLLGARDIVIFETLFWPFAHQFGYTTMDAAAFRRQLTEIRPWLDEPLEFETRLYADLPYHAMALVEMPVYKRMHALLKELWSALDRDGTFVGMVQPLTMN